MTTTTSPTRLALNGRDLSVQDVVRVATKHAPVQIPTGCLAAMRASRATVEAMLLEDRAVYGVTTGFGLFQNRRISPPEVAQLQVNLIRSHAAGVGQPFATPIVRAMMLLRINALVKGYSGVRTEVVELLAEMLNRGVHPIVPEQGSVGSSGDLAPLSHLALVLIGEGKAEVQGMVLGGADALDAVGLVPVVLEAKEGLALINGTQAMGAMGCLALERLRTLVKVADIACSMSVEGLLASAAPFRSDVHRLRPHAGQMAAARNMTRLVAGSELMSSHRDCGQVQDGYSLRCAPQVHGASRDALNFARQVFQVEINAVTDNPLIFAEAGEAVSAGHFHGQPLALPLDFLAIASAELANISERRTERLVNPSLSNGLPAFLTSRAGLNSGYMVAQYTAAALVSENKVHCHPASVDSIPTSAGQEDHVSMGTHAARKLGTVLTNATTTLAIELLCGAQAIDLRAPLPLGAGVAAAHKHIRSLVPHLTEDRPPSPDILKLIAAIDDGSLVRAVEAAIGPLE